MRRATVRRGFAVVCAALLVSAGAPAAWAPDSPVADAAMRGDVETVRELLRQGLDVNAAQGDGMTALHWAADRGDAEVADMLIYAGADVAAVTRIGKYTPLHLAARRGSAEILASLIAAGSAVTAATDNSGAVPLHLAAAAGNPDAIAVLLDAGADPDAQEAAWGQTPLTLAAAANRADAIRILLERGADPDIASHVVDLLAQDKLDRLARERETEVLQAFTGGGDEARNPTPGELQAAVRAGRDVYAEGLPEEEEEEEAEDDDFRRLFLPPVEKTGGLTPLLHAVRQGYVESAVALLDGGADINRVSASDGTSPLVMAAINGQFDLALLLLERGADPNLASELNGVSPLWAAINARWQPRTRFPQPQERPLQSANYLEVARALLDAGADPNHRITRHPWYMVYTGCGNRNCGLVDTNGATAFWRAAYATDVEAMKLLVEHGADPNIPTKAPPRRQRLSPDEFLRQQALNALRDSSYVELPQEERLKLLQDIREQLPEEEREEFPDKDLDNLTADVRTRLIEAAEAADQARANAPDASGLPPVPPGGPGVMPIHAASGVGYGEGFAGNAHRHTPHGWLPAVKYLVEELGADVNARDHNGYTAMHNAASRGDDEMILYLVEVGGDVTVVSRRGQTTADMANGPVQRVSPFPETVALLESLGSHNNNNCLTC
ncbi:MAG: ankyrin repeat domain-containing protein [Gemmatimonadota bacterium]|uniref:ankyrin repeat domain-containing protein n=1 Tax=Candidatus Palauibacter scopulicola TaxID=3056741 RepID=UPI0023A0BB94|nr:ankyrin repeat domain-containing protein [Candidatus Palauibacter scopulicola]MDE2663331.1 ankyrin repeat domain-containing protein [Candidatus Palauibacter scopulicola]